MMPLSTKSQIVHIVGKTLGTKSTLRMTLVLRIADDIEKYIAEQFSDVEAVKRDLDRWEREAIHYRDRLADQVEVNERMREILLAVETALAMLDAANHDKKSVDYRRGVAYARGLFSKALHTTPKGVFGR